MINVAVIELIDNPMAINTNVTLHDAPIKIADHFDHTLTNQFGHFCGRLSSKSIIRKAARFYANYPANPLLLVESVSNNDSPTQVMIYHVFVHHL